MRDPRVYDINNRMIVVKVSQRGSWHLPKGVYYDVFEVQDDTETLLTTGDPWPQGADPHGPGAAALHRYLTPRVQRLQALMTRYRIVASPDYGRHDEYAYLYNPQWSLEQFLAVAGDETYNFIQVCSSRQCALDALAGSVGNNTGGPPLGYFDLDDPDQGEPRSYTALVFDKVGDDDAEQKMRRAFALIDAGELSRDDHVQAVTVVLTHALKRWPDLLAERLRRDVPASVAQRITGLIN